MQKAGYHAGREEKVPTKTRYKKSKGLREKKKAAPGVRTSIFLVRHAGCGGY